tara:strand:+ start:10179 stop:10478 length:300 start_codon:yes stop_codon:yes gene_type:complete
VIVDDLLGRAPAQKNGNLIFQLLAGHQKAVLGRALDGVTERADPARDDRDLVHGIAPEQHHCDQRVPHFMMRDDFPRHYTNSASNKDRKALTKKFARPL